MTSNEINKLASEASYDGQRFEEEIIETHISWVLLFPDYALKIKKPKTLSFLDFSSPEQRKYYCDREVELNQRITDMYLKTIPIYIRNGQFSLLNQNDNPDFQIYDYAVLMKRMDNSMLMDRLLMSDQVTPQHISAIVDQLVEFHKNATIVKPDFQPETLKANFNDIRQTEDWISKHIDRETAQKIEAMIQYSNQFIDGFEENFASRIQKGLVRDVHGDLHSGNIFLTPEPIIFDCIEFSDKMRQIDLLDEVGFLYMDLENHGKNTLAGQFLDEYRKKNEIIFSDVDHAIFNYFRLYRANVRMKVMILKAVEFEHTENVPKSLKMSIQSLLTLMDGYSGL